MNDALGTTALTPFLGKIQYAWDSTSLGWLKECPRKYYYSMIVGWRPKTESVNLIFGSWYHQALELYDKARASGIDHEEALLDAVHFCLKATWINGRPWVSDHNSKTRETLIRSVVWYLDNFGANDPAKTVVLADGRPAVELSFKLNLDWGPTPDQPYILCGHLDKLVEYASGIYDLDRKTTSTTLTPSYFDQFDPDNQMSLYSFASKVVFKTDLKGVIIDAAQIAVGFTRFARGFTYRTETQIEEWLRDSRYWFNVQAACAKEDYYPMNDKSCHKYGGCHFRGICSKSPEVRDAFLKSDFEIAKWNPMEPR
jgi:hypothetical protein